jgi:TonB family protein
MSVPGSTSQQAPLKPAAARKVEVRLNWELPAWLPSVQENLSSVFRSEAPSAPLGFRPGIFWKDVFVDQRLNWKSLARSYAGHLVFAGLVYVVSMPFYWHRLVVITDFHHDRIEYVNPEEDILPSEPEQAEVTPQRLAPIISRSSRAQTLTPGDVRKRAVEAVAIPKWADNTTHTIVAPTAPKILASAPIPDIVLSTPTPQAPPVASVASNTPKLVAPVLDVTPVAPPPDVAQTTAKLTMPALPEAAAIAPPVQTNGARNLASLNIAPLPEAVNAAPKLPVQASHTLPNMGAVEPIAPAPDAKSAGATQLARALPGAAQPVAPPPDARGVAGSLGNSGKLPGTAEPVAPPPDVRTTGSASSASGALISLNLNPVADPPRLPDGNSRGSFAGQPHGNEDASGAPALKEGANGPGGDSPTATKDELGIVAAAVPHGIMNGASVIPLQSLNGNPAAQNSLLAMARAPHMNIPPPKPAKVVDEPSALDERVFRGRKYYTMALNKPNLTSAGGSWIFRFAERGSASKSGEVTAPIPVREVDAAYPADLIRDNVQGVVILYAVIRSNGSVAEVKILEGFDDRLDENARKALSAWQFVPGTRDGNPVDLEAVVRIPFRSKRAF